MKFRYISSVVYGHIYLDKLMMQCLRERRNAVSQKRILTWSKTFNLLEMVFLVFVLQLSITLFMGKEACIGVPSINEDISQMQQLSAL